MQVQRLFMQSEPESFAGTWAIRRTAAVDCSVHHYCKQTQDSYCVQRGTKIARSSLNGQFFSRCELY